MPQKTLNSYRLIYLLQQEHDQNHLVLAYNNYI